MEAELEAAEGSETAQGDIRAKYELQRKAVEKQQENEQTEVDRKAFERKKANDIMQVLINGAVAFSRNFAEMGFWGALAFNPVLLGLMAMQMALISAQKFVGERGGLIPEFAKGGMVYGPSHADGGVKYNAGGRVVELEGGEAVINKRSTAMFSKELSSMNVAGGGRSFADGGITPGTSNKLGGVNGGLELSTFADKIISGINNKSVLVSESSITNTQTNVTLSESNARLF